MNDKNDLMESVGTAWIKELEHDRAAWSICKQAGRDRVRHALVLLDKGGANAARAALLALQGNGRRWREASFDDKRTIIRELQLAFYDIPESKRYDGARHAFMAARTLLVTMAAQAAEAGNRSRQGEPVMGATTGATTAIKMMTCPYRKDGHCTAAETTFGGDIECNYDCNYINDLAQERDKLRQLADTLGAERTEVLAENKRWKASIKIIAQYLLSYNGSEAGGIAIYQAYTELTACVDGDLTALEQALGIKTT